MSNNEKPRRKSHYKIQPLGYAALALIVLIIIACIILLARKPAEEGGEDILTPTDTPVPTEEVTPTPSPTPTPKPDPRSATIRSLGEIAMQANLLEAARSEDGSYDFSEMFSEISDVMGDADYTIADVEGSLGGTKDASGDRLMLTPPTLIHTLRECGVDMLNLANDQALNGGFEDLLAAIENCQAEAMNYIGASTSQEERNMAKVIDINGIRVGFVAYTESVNGMEAQTDAAAAQYGVHMATNSNPVKDVQACRDAGAEVVVACVSWGEMLNRSSTESQKYMAQVLVQCGVDVILGYNPHVIQSAFWLDQPGNTGKRTLCLLSHGNFLSDFRDKYTDSGVIFQFTIQERDDLSGFDIVSPQYIPTYVWRIENEDGSYDYRTLAVGQWLETSPDGMNYTQESRMREVWAEAQSVMGADVATISNE